MWYLALRAAEKFHTLHKRYPGSDDEKVADDVVALKQVLKTLLTDLGLDESAVDEKYVQEMYVVFLRSASLSLLSLLSYTLTFFHATVFVLVRANCTVLLLSLVVWHLKKLLKLLQDSTHQQTTLLCTTVSKVPHLLSPSKYHTSVCVVACVKERRREEQIMYCIAVL